MDLNQERVPGAKLVPPEGMTKTQYKKLLKRQRWEAEKVQLKQKRKEIQKLKNEARKAQIADLKAKGEPYNHLVKRRYQELNRNENGEQNNANFGMIIDCGYDDYMLEKEVVSLSGQITRAYSTNRTNISCGQLLISGLDKRLLDRFETRIPDYKSWKSQWINFTQKSLKDSLESWEWDQQDQVNVDVADNNKIKDLSNVVYLSADTEETLTELKPNHVYVIGGIVDKGRHKNLCKSTADKLGIKTARLPIDEYIHLSGRKVLTTAHVVELLLKWNDFKDWKQAFEAVLPPRKLTNNKSGKEEEENEDEGEEDDDEENDNEEEGGKEKEEEGDTQKDKGSV